VVLGGSAGALRRIKGKGDGTGGGARTGGREAARVSRMDLHGVKREGKGARPRCGVVGDVSKRRVTQDACLPGGEDDQEEGIASVEKKQAKNRQSTFQRKAMEKKSRRGKRKKICRILIYFSKKYQRLQTL
jgi:hypothetical protein